jgi:DtxR family Mn-dependent transcriptional regulator
MLVGMSDEQGEGALTAAEQSYLVTIRNVRSESPLTGAALARRMGVSPQATSEMLRRLGEAGLVSVGKARDVQLTPRGRAVADVIFRRHSLVEWLLTSVLGIGWAESDEEAMRLQAHISPSVEDALDALLGHPETCPHGNPIDQSAAERRPPGVPLSDVDSGEVVTIYRITEEAEEDSGLLSYLQARGLRPGAVVTVLARSGSTDSLTLDGPLGRATLGLRPAGLIRVLPGEAERSLFHVVPVTATSRSAQASA